MKWEPLNLERFLFYRLALGLIDCAFVVWGLIGCAFLLAMDFPFVTRKKKKKKEQLKFLFSIH